MRCTICCSRSFTKSRGRDNFGFSKVEGRIIGDICHFPKLKALEWRMTRNDPRNVTLGLL